MAKTEQNEMSEKELLQEISEKLDKLIAVVSAQGKDLDTQITILTNAGIKSEEISSLTGRPAGTIRRKRSIKK
jgi:hypothetical protein